ncbi:MAG: hypothetical protein R2780_01630 [Crocinitomicaceae bacterium]|nr:hypothetical protein [Crocinitomicaceae bacterium]
MRKATIEELENVMKILNVLRKDPEIFPRLKIGTILTEEQFLQSYEDWVRLVRKLEHYHEVEFFKTHWVPICFDEFVFIDVAQENWCIFEGGYNCVEDEIKDHYWYKIQFFIDLDDLLKNSGDFEYLDHVYKTNRDQRFNDLDKWIVSPGIE